MIQIQNWNKLIGMFKSKVEVWDNHTHYVIHYYYPSLPVGDYYTITLSKFGPPQAGHEHENEYLMLCGETCYWLDKREIRNVDSVYEAIVDVVCRHDYDVTKK